MNRFLVTGAASPDLPLRLLNLFAQRDVAVEAAQLSREGDRYRVAINCDELPEDAARTVLEKMRAMVLVEAAELSS